MINNCTIEGYVCKEPRIYETANSSVCSFTLRHWHGKYKGEDQGTTFFNVSIFGKPGEWFARDARDKDQVVVVGQIKLREVEKNGKKYTNLDIRANEVTNFSAALRHRNGEDNGGESTSKEELIPF